MSIDTNSDRPQKKATLFKDLFRICVYIVLAPLILLFAGPILLIAAIFGRISLGRLQLRPNKYYQSGRLWAFILGVIVCTLSWGGLVWLWQNESVSSSLRAYTAPFLDRIGMVSPGINRPDPLAVLTATPLPVETPISTNTPAPIITPTMVPTSTEIPQPPSPSSSPTNTATPTQSPTPTITPTVTSTPTEIPVVAVSTALITSTQSVTTTTFVTNTDRLALTPQQTLDTANQLLVTYMQDAVDNDTPPLADFWAGPALQDVETFAAQIKTKYQSPITITYQILTLIPGSTISNTVVLTTTLESRELWQYEDIEQQKSSLSDYVYTLTNQGDGWKIIAYQFKVLAPAPTPVLVTNTTTITSE